MGILQLMLASVVVTDGKKTCSKSVPFDLKVGGKATLRNFKQTDSDSRLGTYSRQYYVNVPSGYTGKEQLPVVVYFHGWCDDTTWEGKFPTVANKENFIFIRPIGMQDGQKDCPSWNVGGAGNTDVCVAKDTTDYEYTSCKTTGQTGDCNCYTCYDDVKMFSDLMTSLSDELCIDEDLIFASGSSNGGMFLYPLAAGLADRNLSPQLRAIAPYYGAFFAGLENVPSTLKGTSVFAHHGLKDTEVPAGGGEADDGWLYTNIDTTLGDYASINGCSSSQSKITTAYDGRQKFKGCYEHLGCSGDARVLRCNFNEDHGFWENYQEEMLWSFLSPIVSKSAEASV